MMRRDSAWKQPNLLKQAMRVRRADRVAENPRGAAAELRRLPLDESPSEQVKTLVAQFIADLDQGTAYPSAYPHPDPGDDHSDDPTDEG